jgi:hypothetical protein
VLPHHRRRTACRLCGSAALERVIALTATPPANALVGVERLGEAQARYPLDVYRCGACTHLQLLDIVDPKELFSTYLYVSGTSPVMVDYLAGQARAIIARLGLKPGDLVVEIGANDGTLLRFFRDAGMRVVGVDPAANIAPDDPGIEAIVAFFDSGVARRIVAGHGPAAAVVAYNVCAHIDDLDEIVRGVRELIGERGHFVFEVGYLLDVYRKTLFDTIYHEHVDYHRVEPLRAYFARHGLRLLHAERSDIQGGALVGTVGSPAEPEDASVEVLIRLEREAGLHRAETFLRYADGIARRRTELTALLRGLKAAGRTIAAYGAPAKATTLMYHFGLDASVIDYIVDDNPLKQGLFTPGLHVPVLATTALYERRPDYVLVLAWNFADSIIAKHRAYAGDAGRFIVPLPDLRIAH